MSRPGLIIDIDAITQATRLVINGALYGDVAVVIIDAGRSDRAVTEELLAERDISYDMLITRESGDETPGSAFKMARYNDEISDSYKIDLVVEADFLAFIGWLSLGLSVHYTVGRHTI